MGIKYVPGYVKDMSLADRTRVVEAMSTVLAHAAKYGVLPGGTTSDWLVYWAKEIYESMKNPEG